MAVPDILKIGTPYGGTVDVIADGGGLRAGRYVLKGTLPSSPDTGTAWHLRDGSVDAGQVAALAAVLGLTGDPTQDGDSWVVRDGEAVLRVYDLPGIPFSYDASPDDGSCPSIPIDGYGGPDSPVGCVMTEPAPATTPLPGPDEATLGDLGRAFLAAFAADGSQQVWDGMPYGAVQVDPRVDGVQTSGLGASLQVSLDGVTAASGYLTGFVASGLDRGDDYPLRSAKDVFASLASLPQPAIACAEEAHGPMCGGDVIITGATYGLMLAFDDGTPVLVPAWLFTIDGSDLPMAQVAVQTRYLGEPSNLGGGGSGSGGGSSTPGSAGTGTTVDPAPPAPPAARRRAGRRPRHADRLARGPATDPVPPRERSPGQDPASLTLTVSGGCELETAVASARTTATTIVVAVTFDTIACANDMGLRRAPAGHSRRGPGRPDGRRRHRRADPCPGRGRRSLTSSRTSRRRRPAGGRRLRRCEGVDQLKESPHAHEPVALGLSMVKPCFSMVSTKSMTAPPR